MEYSRIAEDLLYVVDPVKLLILHPTTLSDPGCRDCKGEQSVRVAFIRRWLFSLPWVLHVAVGVRFQGVC